MFNQKSDDVNELITGVVLLQRVMPRLYANSRETIKKSSLIQINQSISLVMKNIKDYCKEPLVLTPLMEVVTLINTITADSTFVETDNETKILMIDRITNAYDQLCLFAGKFYMTHDFTWMLSKTDVLRDIVDKCMSMGFYFGYDKVLREEGLI